MFYQKKMFLGEFTEIQKIGNLHLAQMVKYSV